MPQPRGARPRNSAVVSAARADAPPSLPQNHTLASLSDGAKNPFRKGHTEVPTNFVEPPPGIDMRTGTPSS